MNPGKATKTPQRTAAADPTSRGYSSARDLKSEDDRFFAADVSPPEEDEDAPSEARLAAWEALRSRRAAFRKIVGAVVAGVGLFAALAMLTGQPGRSALYNTTFRNSAIGEVATDQAPSSDQPRGAASDNASADNRGVQSAAGSKPLPEAQSPASPASVETAAALADLPTPSAQTPPTESAGPAPAASALIPPPALEPAPKSLPPPAAAVPSPKPPTSGNPARSVAPTQPVKPVLPSPAPTPVPAAPAKPSAAPPAPPAPRPAAPPLPVRVAPPSAAFPTN